MAMIDESDFELRSATIYRLAKESGLAGWQTFARSQVDILRVQMEHEAREDRRRQMNQLKRTCNRARA